MTSSIKIEEVFFILLPLDAQMKNAHYLQHVPFEDPAALLPWLTQNGYSISSSKLWESTNLPDVHTIDLLIIMGGPMNIYEEKIHPWLSIEKKYIEEVINKNIPVIGICLGAQLIADVLGAKVYKNTHPEIGWFPVQRIITEKFPILDNIPSTFSAFHWHGDTFSIPHNAEHILQSEACTNQAFIYNNSVLALQFHIESSEESIKNLLIHCKDELIDDVYVQREAMILSDIGNKVKEIHETMKILMNNFIHINTWSITMYSKGIL